MATEMALDLRLRGPVTPHNAVRAMGARGMKARIAPAKELQLRLHGVLMNNLYPRGEENMDRESAGVCSFLAGCVNKHLSIIQRQLIHHPLGPTYSDIHLIRG